MLKSLEEHAKDYHIYVFGFDEDTYHLLKKLALPNVTVISMDEFENADLKKIKLERTLQEYCWTCTAFSISYAISKYDLPQITYLDADLFFFSDPGRLLEEMGNSSILITEHRYTPKYDQSAESGIYCVQFVSFKNDQFGLEALNWWRDRCGEWCFARHEDGKFGDQKYLDDWTTRFKNVHVLQHLGGGIAPWNVQQYDLFFDKDELFGQEISTGKKFPVVFYHFHDFKFPEEGAWGHTGDYHLKYDVYQFIYKKYLSMLLELNVLCKDIKSDLIKLPRIVSTYEWEKLFLPKLKIEDRNFFRSIYKTEGSFLELDDSRDAMDASVINKLIQNDFRLDQSYHDFRKIRDFVVEPGELNDLWNQKIAKTTLYLEDNGVYDWANSLSVNVSCSGKTTAFEIEFKIDKDITGFCWMPMWRNSCIIKLKSIVYGNASATIPIPLTPNHTNAVMKDNMFYFFHSHPTMQWDHLSLSRGSVKISGEWSLLGTWDAYLGFNELLESNTKKRVGPLALIKRYLRR